MLVHEYFFVCGLDKGTIIVINGLQAQQIGGGPVTVKADVLINESS